jgi:hypothetical protein
MTMIAPNPVGSEAALLSLRRMRTRCGAGDASSRTRPLRPTAESERTLLSVPRGTQPPLKEGRRQIPASGRKLGRGVQARISVGLGHRRKVRPCCLDDVIVITGLQNYW